MIFSGLSKIIVTSIMQFWKITGFLLILGGMFVSCGTSFHSKKYQRGYRYGEQQRILEERMEKSAFLSARIEDASHADSIVVVNSAILNADSNDALDTSNENTAETVTSHKIGMSLVGEKNLVFEPTQENGYTIIQQSRRHEIDEAISDRYFKKALYMYLPIGVLLASAVIWMLVFGQIAGMLISLVLIFPFLIVMMVMAMNARVYSADEIRQKRAKDVYLSGFMIMVALFFIAIGLIFLGFNMGLISF
jgi:hypothetical protein